MLLCTKYESSGPCDLRQEDLWNCIFETLNTWNILNQLQYFPIFLHKISTNYSYFIHTYNKKYQGILANDMIIKIINMKQVFRVDSYW